MKLKTVTNRRIKTKKNEGKSRYGHKIALQKRGIFNDESPFSLTNNEDSISLEQLNKLRFGSRII